MVQGGVDIYIFLEKTNWKLSSPSCFCFKIKLMGLSPEGGAGDQTATFFFSVDSFIQIYILKLLNMFYEFLKLIEAFCSPEATGGLFAVCLSEFLLMH